MLVCKQCGWSTDDKNHPDLETHDGSVVHRVVEICDYGPYLTYLEEPYLAYLEEPCGPVEDTEEAKQ